MRFSQLIFLVNNLPYIVLVQYRYHYHISDDTKHDPFLVDYVVRDIIAKYNIKDEDLWSTL